jgi:hypothetical protein
VRALDGPARYAAHDMHEGSATDTRRSRSKTAAATREALLVQHAEARRLRNAAELGGHEWEQASAEVGRIEVEIARIERAMDPPRV